MNPVEIDTPCIDTDPFDEAMTKLAEAFKALVDLANDIAEWFAEIVKEAVESVEDYKDEYDIIDHIVANSMEIRAPTIVRRSIPP